MAADLVWELYFLAVLTATDEKGLHQLRTCLLLSFVADVDLCGQYIPSCVTPSLRELLVKGILCGYIGVDMLDLLSNFTSQKSGIIAKHFDNHALVFISGW